MPQFDPHHITQLKNAFQRNRLTLYLGAGVSQASGLPSWEELVLSLYFRTLNDDMIEYNLRPFPNYLYALAEWWMNKKKEPLDIVIRKIRAVYDDPAFIQNLKLTLYASYGLEEYNINNFELDEYMRQGMLAKNTTLQAVMECCKASAYDNKGVQAIVTYNYDNLVEACLGPATVMFEPIWKSGQQPSQDKIPIYHVHGYLPIEIGGTEFKDIVLSEEQYNSMSQDAYYWGNFVQMNQLTTTTGLMIGISLTDKNLRRILDAVQKMPKRSDNYIVMKRPSYPVPAADSDEMKKILENSRKYMEKFVGGRLKEDRKEPGQVQDIIAAIYKYDEEEFVNGFRTLGLKVIFIDEHSDIPQLMNQIIN